MPGCQAPDTAIAFPVSGKPIKRISDREETMPDRIALAAAKRRMMDMGMGVADYKVGLGCGCGEFSALSPQFLGVNLPSSGKLGGADCQDLSSDDQRQPLVPIFCLSSALASIAGVGSCYIYILEMTFVGVNQCQCNWGLSMKSVFALFGITLTLLSGAMPAPLLAQVEPESPVHVAVNGVFFLCPQLVQDAKAPSAQDLAKLGFEVSTEGRPGKLSFKGRDGKWWLLLASFDPTTKRCIVNYVGGGYEQISGVVRDTVIQNKFNRITGGDIGGAKTDVFEGSVPKSSATARIIIIENYTNNSSSIAYSER